MGLKRNQRAVKFVSIKFGQIPIEVPHPTKTSVSREIKKGDKAGQIVHEELFDELEGHIIGISTREHPKYGKKWAVLIQDQDEEMFQLEFDYSSRYTTGFFTRLENCDLSKPVSFRTWYIKQDDGSYRGHGTLEQGGQKIERRYTKDNPNGMPQMEKVFFNGKEQWDSFKQMQFIEAIIKRLEPQFKQNIGNGAAHQVTKEPTVHSGQPNYDQGTDQGQSYQGPTNNDQPGWQSEGENWPSDNEDDLPF